MTKKFLQQQKKRLEQEGKKLEEELKGFAKEDPNVKGNWKTKFPDFGIRTADPSEETDQVEEYEATLPVEYTLETRLKEIKEALERINKNTYGICQKCHRKIKIERLKAEPEADTCAQCAQ